MKDKIRNFAQKLKIEYIGFAKTPDDKTAIVMLFPYYYGQDEASGLSIYTYGEDYHQVIQTCLGKIKDFILSQSPDAEISCYADISPYNDRLLAYNAGLGILGRNQLLINEKYGSFVFIGYLVTNLDFSPDVPLEGHCLNCGRCVEKCPSGALKDGDFSRCLSDITQKKGKLTPDEEALIINNKAVFGCDICQLCCPHNTFTKTPIPEFQCATGEVLSSDKLEAMSNKQFAKQYKNRAFSWRGKSVLLRNLKLLGK